MRCFLLFLVLATPVLAAEPSDAHANQIANYFSHWFDRVNATMAEQPHWASPVATTTPRLVNLLRYDVAWESLKGGHDLVNYGSGKGLEFIPAENIQFIVGIPPYQTVDTHPRKSGFTDQSFLMKTVSCRRTNKTATTS